MNRLFIRARLKNDAPLAIGSGKNDYSDNDILLDSNGEPFIPRTSLAGSCRHYIESFSKEIANKLFGYNTKEDENKKENKKESFIGAE